MRIIMEFRPGAGGEDAQKFMMELLAVYHRKAEKLNCNSHRQSEETRGLTLILEGKEAGSFLGEAGVHRVQRESKGKLHTSTVTVATRPEMEEEGEFEFGEVRMETYRASGNGGQHRNTTDSAVRLTHLETGIVVTSCQERSQHQNRLKAEETLRNRLLAQREISKGQKENKIRAKQVGAGSRAEARRTYNYTRKEVVDEITGERYPLKSFLKGNFPLTQN